MSSSMLGRLISSVLGGSNGNGSEIPPDDSAASSSAVSAKDESNAAAATSSAHSASAAMSKARTNGTGAVKATRPKTATGEKGTATKPSADKASTRDPVIPPATSTSTSTPTRTRPSSLTSSSSSTSSTTSLRDIAAASVKLNTKSGQPPSPTPTTTKPRSATPTRNSAGTGGSGTTNHATTTTTPPHATTARTSHSPSTTASSSSAAHTSSSPPSSAHHTPSRLASRSPAPASGASHTASTPNLSSPAPSSSTTTTKDGLPVVPPLKLGAVSPGTTATNAVQAKLKSKQPGYMTMRPSRPTSAAASTTTASATTARESGAATTRGVTPPRKRPGTTAATTGTAPKSLGSGGKVTKEVAASAATTATSSSASADASQSTSTTASEATSSSTSAGSHDREATVDFSEPVAASLASSSIATDAAPASAAASTSAASPAITGTSAVETVAPTPAMSSSVTTPPQTRAVPSSTPSPAPTATSPALSSPALIPATSHAPPASSLRQHRSSLIRTTRNHPIGLLPPRMTPAIGGSGNALSSQLPPTGLSSSSAAAAAASALASSSSPLSTSQRAVLEDIQIITDWLGSVHSKPQNLLSFRAVIQRMKATIFTPIQVRRARAAKNAKGEGVTGRLGTARLGIKKGIVSAAAKGAGGASSSSGPNALNRISSVTSTTSTSNPGATDSDGYASSAAATAASSSRNNNAVALDDYAADNSDGYASDEGLDFEDDEGFDDKLASFINKTTKREEDLKGDGRGVGGMSMSRGAYHHAPGVAFINGRWVQTDLPPAASSLSSGHHNNQHHAHFAVPSELRSSRARSHASSTPGISELEFLTSEDDARDDGGLELDMADALDGIPDFNTTSSHDPSSASPSSVGQKRNATIALNVGTTQRRGSYSGSGGSTNSGTILTTRGVTISDRSMGASSVSTSRLNAGGTGSGLVSERDEAEDDDDNDSEPSISNLDAVRSHSPSRAMSVSHSRFSRADFDADPDDDADDGDNDVDASDLQDFGEMDIESSVLRTPSVLSRGVSVSNISGSMSGGITTGAEQSPSVAMSRSQSQGNKLQELEMDDDALDEIPDFEEQHPAKKSTMTTIHVPNHPTEKAGLAFPFSALPPAAHPIGAQQQQQQQTSSAITSPTISPTIPPTSGTGHHHTKSSSLGFISPTALSSSSSSAASVAGPKLVGRTGSLDATSLIQAAMGAAATGSALAGASAAATSSQKGGATTSSSTNSKSSPPSTSTTLSSNLLQKPSPPSRSTSDFPDTLDFSDSDEDVPLPLNAPVKTMMKHPPPVVSPSATAVAGVIPLGLDANDPAALAAAKTSKMRTFTSLPAALKFIPAIGNIAGGVPPSKSSGALSDLEDADVDTNATLPLPSSSTHAAGTHSDTLARLKKKSFLQRTMMKAKHIPDEGEFPDDLDDLSDADWSDAEHDEKTMEVAKLGRAARVLGEFEVSPALQQEWQTSEQEHSKAFNTLLHSSSTPHAKDCLNSDGLTHALRAEFVTTKFTLDFMLAFQRAAGGAGNSSSTNARDDLSRSTGGKHRSKAASASAASVLLSNSAPGSTLLNAMPPLAPTASSQQHSSSSSSRPPPMSSSPALTSSTPPLTGATIRPARLLLPRSGGGSGHHRGKSSPSSGGAGKK